MTTEASMYSQRSKSTVAAVGSLSGFDRTRTLVVFITDATIALEVSYIISHDQREQRSAEYTQYSQPEENHHTYFGPPLDIQFP